MPRHLLFYSRLYNLYLFGGYYIDLAFYSAGGSNSLREAINGYAVTTYCYTFPEQQQQQQHGCSSSMLMKFPAGSPVLLCTLAAFDEDHFSYHSVRGLLNIIAVAIFILAILCIFRRLIHLKRMPKPVKEVDLFSRAC